MLAYYFHFISNMLSFLWVKHSNLYGFRIFFEPFFVDFQHFIDFLYSIFWSFSGPVWLFTFHPEFFWQLLLFHFLVFIIATFLDYLTLNKISQKNLQNKNKKSYNKSFIIFFILLRFCFLDLFVFSSLGAYFLNIKLSKKQILIISTIAQILRFLVFVIFYILYNWVYLG